MSWLTASLYDWFTRGTEEACFRAWRSELLSLVSGRVLEVGVGTGANLAHYGTGVGRLVLTEPDQQMRRKLEQRLDRSKISRVELVDSALEALPLADNSFDFVVCTLVLCSVTSPECSLAEIKRVLRPGGALVFMEHVASEDRPRRFRWQRRIEPLWKRLMGNCHLTRRTASTISEAGFVVERLTRESIRKALPIVRPAVRGVARKPG